MSFSKNSDSFRNYEIFEKNFQNGEYKFESLLNFFYKFYNNLHISLPLLILFSFWFSLLLAPWNRGVIYLFIFIYFSELARCVYNHKDILTSRHHFFRYALMRSAIIIASIVGWYTGKFIIHNDNQFEQFYEWWDYYIKKDED